MEKPTDGLPPTEESSQISEPEKSLTGKVSKKLILATLTLVLVSIAVISLVLYVGRENSTLNNEQQQLDSISGVKGVETANQAASVSNLEYNKPVLTSEDEIITGYTGFFIIKLADQADFSDIRDLIRSYDGILVYENELSRNVVADLSSSTVSEIENNSFVSYVEAQGVVSVESNLSQYLQTDEQFLFASEHTTENKIDVFIIDTGADEIGSMYASKTTVSGLEDAGPNAEDPHGRQVASSFLSAFPEYKKPENINLHSIKVARRAAAMRIDKIAEAVRMAADNGAEVINISISDYAYIEYPPGSGQLIKRPASKVLQEALEYASGKGATIVTSAGNEAGKLGYSHTAVNANTISFCATNNGNVADYSDGVYEGAMADFCADGNLGAENGTSFASPRGAAYIAQIRSTPITKKYDLDGDGKWDKDEVILALKDGTKEGKYALTDTDALTPKVSTLDKSRIVGSVDQLGRFTQSPTYKGRVKLNNTEEPASRFSNDSRDSAGRFTNDSVTNSGRFTSAEGSAVNQTSQSKGSTGGIVPCDGSADDPCTACHVAQLGQNILTFLIQIMVILAGIAIAWAGLLMAMAAGNENQVTKARGIFTNVVIGLIITLAAWLIVDTVMKVFVDQSKLLGPWNEIQCTGGVGAVTTAPQTPPSGGVSVSALPGDTYRHLDAVDLLLKNGVAVVSSGNCSDPNNPTCTSLNGVKGETLNKVIDIANVCSECGLRLTGGTENAHTNSCHQAGTCVDINCGGGCTPEQIRSVLSASAANGSKAIYEVKTFDEKEALVNKAVPAENIEVVPWAKASHFSLYTQ